MVLWRGEGRPTGDAVPGRGRAPHKASAAVLALALAITAVLTVITLRGYQRAEHRLLSLQTKLTAWSSGAAKASMRGRSG